MAIKLSGDTIIDDSRVIVNADKIGIGTTNPQVALEIFSGDVGIGTTNPTASNIEIALNNNTNVLAVGIVTADNIFGTFKGTIDDGVGIDKANRVKIISNADNAVKYLSFVDNTGANGFGTIFYNTNITYNPNSDGNDNGELNIDGNVKIDGRLSAKDFLNVKSVGFVTAGTGLEVTQGGLILTGPSTFSGNLIPGANDTYDIGKDPSVTGNYRWNKVYAKEYYGTFKGTIDPSVADDKIEQGDTKAQVVDTNGDGHFLVETENQERLRIDSDGNVGVGTTNPQGTVHISSGTSGDATLILEADTDNSNETDTPYIVFRQDGGVDASAIGHGVDPNAGGYNGITIANSIINGFISFATGSTFGYTNATERLRITSTGDVGIGTKDPDAAVTSSNTSKLAVGIVTAREYYGTFKGTIDPTVSDDKIAIGTAKAQVVDIGDGEGHFFVQTENQERLRVDDDGILLIGTDTPRNIGFSNQRGQLQIEGTSVNTSSFSLVNNQNTTQSPIILFGKTRGTSTGAVDTVADGDTLGKIAFCPADGTDVENNTAQIKVVVNGTVSGNQIPTDITFETSPTNSANRKERLRITSDGNVGIGTEIPTDAVHSTNNAKLAVGIVTAREYYGTFKGTIDPAVADNKIQQGDTKAEVIDTNGNGYFLVETEGTERLRIDKDGNITFDLPTTVSNQVAITRSSILKNTTAATPRDDFYIDGDLKPISQIASTWNAYHSLTRHDAGSAFGPYLMLAKNRNDAYNSNTIVQDNDEFGNIAFFGNDGTRFREGARIRGEVDGTPASNQMPGALTFWTDNGTASSSSMAEKVRITSDGNVGIGTDDPIGSNAVNSNDNVLAVGILTAREFYGNTFYGNLVGGISNTGDVTITGNLAVEGNTTLGDVVGDTLTVNATPTFEEDATFKKNVSIGGTLTYEDVTNVDSIGIVTAGRGLRVTQGGIKVNAGVTTLMDNVGIGTEDPNSNMNGKTGTTLAVAGIVTANEYYGTFKGTIDNSTVNTFSINNNIEDIFSVTSNELSADDAGGDNIVFWDDSESKLTYLTVGTGLSITGTEITATKDAGKTYTLPLIGTNGGSGVGIVTWTLTDNDSPVATDPVTLKAGSNITISSVDEINHEFKIEAVQGAGVGIAASASQVLNVHSGNIGGVNPGVTSDRIVYWNEDGISGGRLDYLDIGNGLEIISDQLRVDSSVVGKSYELPVTVENGTTGNGGNSGIATVILRDTTNSIDDPVTIKAGSGIVIDSVTDGFKISADISNGGGGGISTVNVIQYSDNADPRTVRSAVNPIDVQETVGIVTIGIGTTSNAYGSRFLGPDTPSGAVEGDIWYDTSTTGQGISKVAILKDEKGNQVNGGTFQNGGWRDRDLTVKEDPSNFVTFTATPSGQSTIGSGNTPGYWSLPAGNYKIDWSAPAHEVARHKTRLVYSTTQSHISTPGLDASASFVEGSASHTASTNVTTQSTGSKIINLSQTTWFKIMHYCSGNNNAGDGFGRRQSSNPNTDTGTNIYTQVRIEDLAAAVKDSSPPNKIIQGDTKAEVIDTNGDGHFLVETENQERLRITSDGKVGIGMTDPKNRLHVYQGSSGFDYNSVGDLIVEDDIGATIQLLSPSTHSNQIHFGDETNGMAGRIKYNHANHRLSLWTQNNERVTLHGKTVGIGTTRPDDPVSSSNDAKLAVGIVTAHEAYINALNLNTSGAGVGDLLTSGGPDGIFGIYNTTNSGKTVFPIKDSGGNYNNILELLNDKAIIDGNVGIGSTIPKTKLDVHGTDAIVVPVGTTAERPSNASSGMFRYNTTEGQFEGYTNSWGAIAGSGSGSGGGNVATSIQTFTTDGSFTYTPTPGTTSIVVHVIGAGGGSGTPKYFAWSGGGGAGGVAIKTYSVTEFGTSAAIEVGAKGTAGTANNTNNPQSGGTGGYSSFNPNGTGVTITAYGGVGSASANGQGNYTEGGDGGAAANGDLNYTGEKGYVFVDRTVDDNGAWSNYNGIVPDWRYHSGSNKARYHLYRAKPSAGGYGSYGLGGEATTTTESSFYNNGREGNDGAVIIYEYAGSGSGGSGIGSSFVLLPEQTIDPTANTTEIEFNNIPADALEITLMFTGVSANGNNNYMIQLGTASGYIETGYDSLSQNEGGSDDVPATDCFNIRNGAAAQYRTGSMVIKKASSTSYVQTGQFAVSPQTDQGGNQTYGSLSSVSGTVDRLKVKFTGSNIFDAGTMSLSYKTSASGSTAAITKVAVLQDVRSQSINGGTATAGNWHGRRLNTKLDPTNFVAFTSTAVDSNGDGENNTFILGAGTYLLQWRAPGFDAGKMIAKMAYTTDPNYNTLFNSQSSAGVSYLSGETAQTSSGISATSSTASGDLYATGSATVTINQTTYFRLQHYVSAVAQVADQTLGRNNDINGENEIYSQVIVQDLETASLSGGANVSVGTTPPTSPSPNSGDLWWNSDNGDLHVYYTAQWVAVNSDERIQKVSATGGTTDIVNGYKVHKFTTSGTFDVTDSGEVEVLVVAGGGSEGGGNAGCHGGGGGGGGGVVRKLIDVHAGSKYKVTVGAGGGWRSNGGDSSFAGDVAQALGGGAGGATLTANGNGGGSGGGASRHTLTNQGGGSEQVNTYGYGMGNAGGNIGNPTTNSGGGGGAGGPGSSGSPQGNGDGGPGYDASDFEVGLYVGAGGNSAPSGLPGSNSSAEGRTQSSTNGAANTGAGGGGSPGGGTRYSGGSGVVFVRYVI